MTCSNTMINVAVIGAGRWGLIHAQKYARISNVNLFILDSNKDRCVELCELLNATAVVSLNELTYANHIDCASITTPAKNHYEIGSLLLQHEVDVLIEKPFCGNTQQALTLVAMAEKYNRILQVGYIELFNPAFLTAKKLIKSPYYLKSARTCRYDGRANDVSVIMDLMIHDISIICDLLESDVQVIDIIGDDINHLYDSVNVRVLFNNGVVADLFSDRKFSYESRIMEFHEQESITRIDLLNKSVVVERTGEGSHNHCLMSHDCSTYTSDQLNHQISLFLDAHLSRKTPPMCGKKALRALDISCNILQASYRRANLRKRPLLQTRTNEN